MRFTELREFYVELEVALSDVEIVADRIDEALAALSAFGDEEGLSFDGADASAAEDARDALGQARAALLRALS